MGNSVNPKEQIQLNIDGKNVHEVVIRHGLAIDPEPVRIRGNIMAVSQFIEKRKDLIYQHVAHVEVDRYNRTIKFYQVESDSYAPIVTGQLETSEELEEWNINTNSYIDNFAMADFIRMHRSAFSNVSEAMALTSELKNFAAKIQHVIELSEDNRGNTRALKSQAVESNLPKAFSVSLPIFKGMPKQTVEVEVDVKSSDLSMRLVSPEAKEIIDTCADEVIDKELGKIHELCPDIVIIEQ